MKKILVSAVSVMLLASCGGKTTTNNSASQADSVATEAEVIAEAASESVPNGVFAYTVTEDVAKKVQKLLGKEVLVDFEANPIEFNESELAERNAEEYDVMNEQWLVPTDDVYLGFKIVCLKRTDGRYSVIHQCMSTFDGCASVYLTEYYMLDGDKLTKSESIMPELKATDVVDEYDDWYYKQLLGDDPQTLHNMSMDEVNIVLRKNDDNTRDLSLQFMFFGGKWLKWNGEKFVESDEVFTRNYLNEDTAAGFRYGEALPAFPVMKHYSLDDDGDGDITLMRDGSPVINLKYKDNVLAEATAKSTDFCEMVGAVFTPAAEE